MGSQYLLLLVYKKIIWLYFPWYCASFWVHRNGLIHLSFEEGHSRLAAQLSVVLEENTTLEALLVASVEYKQELESQVRSCHSKGRCL